MWIIITSSCLCMWIIITSSCLCMWIIITSSELRLIIDPMFHVLCSMVKQFSCINTQGSGLRSKYVKQKYNNKDLSRLRYLSPGMRVNTRYKNYS